VKRIIFAFILIILPSLAAASCENIDYKSNSYTICDVTFSDDLRLWHTDKNGMLYGGFNRINAALQDENLTLGFAMNAGMYHQNRAPVGLYIENNQERSALADGGNYGNFGLKPNGVFCFGKDHFSVVETNSFRSSEIACQYAIQSGPMLVINDKLHHRFLVNSSSRHIRNGVGVSADGTRANFVISNNTVNFHEFGSLFKDYLKTPNALYFDGKVSRLFAPDLNRADAGFALGVIIGSVIAVDAAPIAD
jgi:uncharacterized protein YigE (DUF2233 family)